MEKEGGSSEKKEFAGTDNNCGFYRNNTIGNFISNVTNTLKKKDGKVSLVGFGTFSVAERAARQGINPATKKPIKIAAKTVAKFKAGSDLADAVMGGKKK